MKNVIRIILILVALCLMSCCWPLGLVRKNEEDSSGSSMGYGQTPGLKTGNCLEQHFIAQGDRLEQVSVSFSQISGNLDQIYVEIRLASAEGDELWTKEFSGNTLLVENYCTIEETSRLQKGSEYSLSIFVRGEGDAEFFLYTTPAPADYAPGQTNLFLDGNMLEGQIYNSYVYAKPLNWKNILFEWGFIWILTGVFLVGLSDRKRDL